MAKNRNRNKSNGPVPKLLVGALVLGMIGWMVFLIVGSKCNTLIKENSVLKEEHTRLESIYISEDKVLREMYENPEKLNDQIKGMGLAMDFPAPDQIVRIDSTGTPLPRQHSLARFNKIVAGNLVISK